MLLCAVYIQLIIVGLNFFLFFSFFFVYCLLLFVRVVLVLVVFVSARVCVCVCLCVRVCAAVFLPSPSLLSQPDFVLLLHSDNPTCLFLMGYPSGLGSSVHGTLAAIACHDGIRVYRIRSLVRFSCTALSILLSFSNFWLLWFTVVNLKYFWPFSLFDQFFLFKYT